MGKQRKSTKRSTEDGAGPSKTKKAKLDEPAEPVQVISNELVEEIPSVLEEEAVSLDADNQETEAEVLPNVEGQEETAEEPLAEGDTIYTPDQVKEDKTLSEGARLALAYAALYLQFNPTPPKPVTKQLRSRVPLPENPFSAVRDFGGNGNYDPSTFQQMELTPQQHAQRKKEARAARAKKGDGKSGERWVFNKARETFLLRRVLDSKEIPDKYFPTALGYLETLKSPSRENTLRTMQGIASDEGERGERAQRLTVILSRK